MGMPGPFELIIILVIVLLIFGGKRLKNIGNEVGGAIKGFKSSMKDTDAKRKKILLKLKLKLMMKALTKNPKNQFFMKRYV